MKTLALWLIGINFMLLSTLTLAKPSCDAILDKEQSVLTCYLSEPEKIDKPWIQTNKQYNDARHVLIETYTLTSQLWPKAEMSNLGKLWKHTLVIYQPSKVNTNQALLFVNGGTRYISPNENNPLPQQLDFARIAAQTQSIVIDLQDVPNQYLTFDDNVLRKEDSIVAYTWNRFMDNPEAGKYWPIHLPMAKAVIKAMDATQQILNQKNIHIHHFVAAGTSKRGLATWLAALSDQRINSIIPIAIDILNTQENLNLIYQSYDNHWPPAFQPFINEKITDRFHTQAFTRLMNIEDPFTYLNCKDCNTYKKRLSIPKYIISASGDDFFVPDSLNLYVDKLPGETNVRVIPNQSHHIDTKIIEEAILAYYQTITSQSLRPHLHWQVSHTGKLQSITTNERPLSVKLWEAENPNTRDFRFAAHITYSAKELKGSCSNNYCHYPITITPPKRGWKANFVEVTFKSLVLTTPTYIIES